VSWLARRLRALQFITDFLLIAFAWSASYYFRFKFLPAAQEGLDEVFLFWFVPLAVLTLYFLLQNGHYNRKRLLSVTSDVMQILRANGMSLVAFIVLLYFGTEEKISRLTIALYAGLSTFLLILARIAFRSFMRKLRRRGELLQRVFVVGDSSQVDRYLETIRYTPGTGLKVVALFGAREDLAWEGKRFPLDAMETELERQKPEIVVLGFKEAASPFVAKFIEKFYDSLFLIQVLPAENQALIGMTTEMIEDLHVLSLNQPQLSVPEMAAKRLIDFVGSGVGLLVLFPFLLVLAILVRLSSPGPIFFGQERIGRDGRRFKMWKFRTMRQGPPGSTKAEWTVENDPRRTKIGTFLRSTSLDELPQLWNVFVGDMSLVGPRPEQPYFVDKFRKEIPAYMLRHRMRAGITGWAQINGWRGDTSLHKRIECDLYYIRNWSLLFDIKILILTFFKGFINKNAY
jgi:exopolysaccharide biosynthesis polyprenyl glycosylphosphotransferase